jgi:membrane fusion protein (multidrug efflux system)
MAEREDGENGDGPQDRRKDSADHSGNADARPKTENGKADDNEDGKPPLYKRPLFWVIAGVVLGALLIGGLLWWLHARQYESTDDAFVDAHIVKLAPQVSGVLTWVAPADNRHVKPGELLAIIEPAGPEAERAQQVANVAQAEAGVKQAEGQLIAAQSDRAQAAANAIAPEATARRQGRDYERYQALLKLDSSAVAASQLDAARAQADGSSAQALAARQQIVSADANVKVAERQVEAARAQLGAAQARLKQSNVSIGYLRLTAPVSGQVVNRMVNVGSYVSPGTQILAIVPDEMWVTANFKETQLRHMQVGQHVDIRVDAYPDVDFEGHVDSLQRGAGQAFALLPTQNATGKYVKVVQRVPVRILFDRPDPRHWSIGPGMSVSPRVKVR